MGDAFYEGIGTEVNLINALDCYLRAENGLYRQIIGGDIYNNDKIDYVIGRQQAIRDKLKENGVIPTKQMVYIRKECEYRMKAIVDIMLAMKII